MKAGHITKFQKPMMQFTAQRIGGKLVIQKTAESKEFDRRGRERVEAKRQSEFLQSLNSAFSNRDASAIRRLLGWRHDRHLTDAAFFRKVAEHICGLLGLPAPQANEAIDYGRIEKFMRRVLADSNTTNDHANKDNLRYPAAAKYLGISISTLKRWKRRRKVAFSKVDGAVSFRKSDLDAALQRHRTSAYGER